MLLNNVTVIHYKTLQLNGNLSYYLVIKNAWFAAQIPNFEHKNLLFVLIGSKILRGLGHDNELNDTLAPAVSYVSVHGCRSRMNKTDGRSLL